jgi:hypothetical protein
VATKSEAHPEIVHPVARLNRSVQPAYAFREAQRAGFQTKISPGACISQNDTASLDCGVVACRGSLIVLEQDHAIGIDGHAAAL